MKHKPEELFAFHHHVTDPDHYDLMFESDSTLLTWQILSKDFEILLTGNQVNCSRIQDHRKEYLSYEGPVSCDRGIVELYDSGKVNIILWEKDLIKYRIFGNLLKGILTISGDINGECFASYTY